MAHCNTLPTPTDNQVPGYNPASADPAQHRKSLFKKKNGELRLSVYDLLKKYFRQQNSFPQPRIHQPDFNPATLRHADIHLQSQHFAGKTKKNAGRIPGRFRGGNGGVVAAGVVEAQDH